MTTIFEITNREKIENYVLNLGKKPFSTKSVAAETDVPLKTVQNVLRKMEINEKIKCIGKQYKQKLFIKKIKQTPVLTNNEKKVLRHVSEYGYTSLRNIAKETQISHQTVAHILKKFNIPMVNKKLIEQRRRKKIGKQLIKVIRRIRMKQYNEMRTKILSEMIKFHN